MFYSCAHTGVLLDFEKNRQCVLQGHSHCISCTAVSGDRRWLVTADIGADCMLIVWDSFSGYASLSTIGLDWNHSIPFLSKFEPSPHWHYCHTDSNIHFVNIIITCNTHTHTRTHTIYIYIYIYSIICPSKRDIH